MPVDSTKPSTDPELVDHLLARLGRTTDQVFSMDELRNRLLSGTHLRIKYGVDVTAPFLHLGHAVNLRMMRLCQEAGHQVVFLVGDFTTRIGDPTGRSQTRPLLGEEAIRQNAARFHSQAARVLLSDDPALFECRWNGEWYDPMPARDLLNLASRVTQARLMGRDMFRKRQADGADIFMHELFYPVLQGWDSVVLRSDLTIVGSDQLFNEMMGRFFQEKEGQRPQVVVTSRITAGLDGVNKQSKSLNNYIAIEDDARAKFGKAMSLPDSLLKDWLEVYSDLEMPVIGGLLASIASGGNPRDVKLELAASLVRIWHGASEAREERDWFLHTFGQRDFPPDAPLLRFAVGAGTGPRLIDVLVAACPTMSRSELRRLLSQGAVSLDGRAVSDPALAVELKPAIACQLRVGKKGFYRLVVKQ